jgi:predicted metal-dependent phosphoesterase TrpH
MRIDLHTHTLASDGQLSPAELLRQAAAAGVNLLAITDHDTIAGVAELDTYTAPACTVIPGIELSTHWRKIGIHILGLNIDLQNTALLSGIAQQQAGRLQRAERIAEKLEKLGFSDLLDGANKLAGDSVVGRPHFAQHLVNSGQVKSMKEAFRKFLGPGKPGDIRDVWAPMEEVIAWIHAAGGSAILAHPAKYRLTNLKMEELVKDFRADGGDAIEVISGKQDPTLTSRLGRLASRIGLQASAGSDFHRPGQAWAALGDVAPLPTGCRPIWESW